MREYKYFCLCGNSILLHRKDMKVKCNQNHGGNIKMLCDPQCGKNNLIPKVEYKHKRYGYELINGKFKAIE